MIILYGPPFAPYTEKVRRGLMLKGLAFDLREPQGPEDYKRWSPKTGLLPVLEIDGERVADSTAILRRLDALRPEPPLLASEPHVRGQQEQLEDWADEALAWYFNRWLRIQREKEEAEEAAQERTGLARIPSLRRLFAWLRAGGTFERPEANLLRGLGSRLDDLINFLGTRRFFYADNASMADLAVYGMLFTMVRDFIPGTSKLIADRPILLEYMRRVEKATEPAAA